MILKFRQKLTRNKNIMRNDTHTQNKSKNTKYCPLWAKKKKYNKTSEMHQILPILGKIKIILPRMGKK